MVMTEEIPVERAHEFWKIHFGYLVDDGIITDEEDKAYCSGCEYRGHIESLMKRSPDKLHMVCFVRDGVRIGVSQAGYFQPRNFLHSFPPGGHTKGTNVKEGPIHVIPEHQGAVRPGGSAGL